MLNDAERQGFARFAVFAGGATVEAAEAITGAGHGALQLGSDGDAMEYVARATPTTRAVDNPFLWMLLQGNLGLSALLAGDADAARQAFRARSSDYAATWSTCPSRPKGSPALPRFRQSTPKTIARTPRWSRSGTPLQQGQGPRRRQARRYLLQASPHTSRS